MLKSDYLQPGSIKHKGTILTSPNLAQILQKSMIPKIMDDETLKNIFEIRLFLEIGMADLIFHNITDEDIIELEKIANNEPGSTDDVLFDIENEIQFHSKLYDITNNYSLKNFQKKVCEDICIITLIGSLNRIVF